MLKSYILKSSGAEELISSCISWGGDGDFGHKGLKDPLVHLVQRIYTSISLFHFDAGKRQ
jgi:hypothetical protein